jgi:C-terminal processing protease CtpA/Prc
LTRLQIVLFVSFVFALGSSPATAQVKVDLVQNQGASLACVGLGPAASLAEKCVEMFQDAGFVREDELGFSGMTIGTTGKDDAVILTVDPGSAAAHAGLEVGDTITAVNGKSVKPTPGMAAAQAVFGRRGDALHLTLRRAGADHEITLVRSAQSAPDGPKSPSKLIHLSPVIDWRGDFVPCMGAGLAGGVAIDHCENVFKPYGFIKTGDFGSTGFQLDLARETSAIVSAVDPNSAAAAAGVQVGDEIVVVEGHPLTASAGEQAKEQIFGKAGAQFHITIRRAKLPKTVVLQLAAK